MASPFRRAHAGRRYVIILVAALAARLSLEDSYLIARFCSERRRHRNRQRDCLQQSLSS